MAKAKKTIDNSTIHLIDANIITPDKTNSRVYNQDDLQELADSIKQVGLIQPVSVQPDADGFQIICGHRRYYACVKAGYTEIPCIIFKDLSENDIKLMQISENIQRVDIHPLDEAEAINQLRRLGMTYKAIADKLGKTVNYITKRQALNDLTDRLKERFRLGELDLNSALKIAIMPEAWQKANESRQNFNYMGIQFKHLDDVRFDKTECQTCQFNSACNSLFEVEDALCYNEQCYEQKTFKADIALIDEALRKYEYFISTNYQTNKHEQAIKLAGKTILTRDLYELLDDEPSEPVREYYQDNQEYLSDLEDYKRELKEYNISKTIAVPAFVFNGYDSFTEKLILLNSTDNATITDNISTENRLEILQANLDQAVNEKEAYITTKHIDFQRSLDELFEEKGEAMQSIERSEDFPVFCENAIEYFKRKLMEDYAEDVIKNMTIQDCVNLWVINDIAERYIDIETLDLVENMAAIINPVAHYEKKKQLAIGMEERINAYENKIQLLRSKIDSFVNNSNLKS